MKQIHIKRIKKGKFYAIVVFTLLYVLLQSSTSYAYDGQKYYMGFDGANASNSFKTIANYFGTGGSGNWSIPPDQEERNTAWGSYEVNFTQSINAIGLKFEEYTAETGEWIDDGQGFCPTSIYGTFSRIDDISTFQSGTFDYRQSFTTNNIHGGDISTELIFGLDGGTLQSDGTCIFPLRKIDSGGIPSSYNAIPPSGKYVLFLKTYPLTSPNTYLDPMDNQEHNMIGRLTGNDLTDLQFNIVTPSGVGGTTQYIANNQDNYIKGVDFYFTQSALTIGTNPLSVTCGALDIFCYIKQGFIWAFWPDFSHFNQFTQLKDDLSQKPPFGYITGIYTAMAGITDTTGDNSFTLESTSEITDLIFTPIRQALSWILYFAFGFVLFLRFRDIQI